MDVRRPGAEHPPRRSAAIRRRGLRRAGASLEEGRGYREIHHPDQPRHAHYPPGYPLVLAGLWRGTGPSAASAHALSVACTLLATLAFWAWLRRLYEPATAALLGLALAGNWRWQRDGGAILSEPLFLLETALVLLVATRRGGGVGRGIVLGLLLGFAMLTRQVALGLTAAVVLDLALRGRRRTALAAVVVAGLALVPWIVWQAGRTAPRRPGFLSGAACRHGWRTKRCFMSAACPIRWSARWSRSARCSDPAGRGP